jgi:hypothetical protein
MFFIFSCFFVSNVEAESISETTVTGHIAPSIIKVSAPAKIVFSIDSNAEKENQFISSDIIIENRSNAPVKVKINKGTENFIQTEDSLWKPVDVLPVEYHWDTLGTMESESYLALGVKAVGAGWRSLTRKSVLYVKEHNESIESIEFGEMNSNSTIQMMLVCSHGLSFSSEKECTYNIIWSFSLGD